MVEGIDTKRVLCKYQLPCGWCELHNRLCNEFIVSTQPQVQEIIQPSVYKYALGYEYECCKNCSNNPANGGSGICNCVAPALEVESRGKYQSLSNSSIIAYSRQNADNKTPTEVDNATSI